MHSTETDSDRWQKLKNVFNKAIELAPDQRRVYLSALQLDEKTLSAELVELLASEAESSDFLKEPLGIDFDSPVTQSFIGAKIGHYTITNEIGRGGMGAVFEAVRQDGDFEQRVAVKLTDNNFLSDEFLRRFNNERQILAGLEHPNIVRLFDGGILPNQTPYFVMEYVEGVAINRYCRETDVNLDEKLGVFLQVCAAVQYAHQQLIVHRDLKPSNILVTKSRQVKLFDFGIAKTLNADAQTQTVNAPHTPAYASPEQIKGETITTLSDVYSLGIILYELLTEQTPAEIYRTSELGLPQAICETDPKPPSAAISSKFKLQTSKSDAETPEDDNRQAANIEQPTNPKSTIQNPKSLRGDLDNNVLKALQKEKERRYNSVEQFADDIRNHLNGLPVKAHPQSFEYRAAKFINRKRLAVSLAAIAVLLITGGVIAALWQSFEAARQRQIAEQRFDQVRKIANSLILDYHDEIAKLEGSTKLREKLVADGVNYLDAVAGEETENPELLKESAIAYRKIGDVQGLAYGANLGKTNEALENYQKSVDSLEKAVAFAPSDLPLKDEIIKSYRSLAESKYRYGDKEESKNILKKAVAVAEGLNQSSDVNLDRQIAFLRLKLSVGDNEENNLAKLAIYQQTASDAEALYSAYPQNEVLLKTMMTSVQRTSTTLEVEGKYQEKMGDAEKAHNYYSQAVEYNYRQVNYSKTLAAIGTNKNANKQIVMGTHANLASILNLVGENKKALENIEIAENLIKEIEKSDSGDREILFTRVPVLSIKQRILNGLGKSDAALDAAQTGFEIAQKTHQSDPKNAEVFSWTIQMSKTTMEILEKQNNHTEAARYRQIFQEYKKQFEEKLGGPWKQDIN